MSRDQRMRDNWALLYAIEQAASTSAPVCVAFNLVPAFLGAGARQFVFMLQGLKELSSRLNAAGIPFFLLQAGFYSL
jgi:deoxyribodipyrimidine photo-lyase